MPVKPALLACLLVASACSANDGVTRETGAAACSDGIDNDANGTTDCDEPSCLLQSFCSAAMDAGPQDGAVVDSGPLCSAPIDLVFVIDVSTSMGNVLSDLAAGLRDVWNGAQHLCSNLEVRLVVFVDDALVANDGMAYANADEFLADFWAYVAAGDRSPVSHVANQDTPENSLDALYLAAESTPWRADSTRIVVHATDDSFREPPYEFSSVGPGTGVPAVHTYAETVAALTSHEVRVGTFAPLRGYCDDASFPDPSAARGYSSPYNGMPSIADATGGRAWFVCDVRDGHLNMGTAIAGMISEEYCTLY